MMKRAVAVSALAVVMAACQAVSAQTAPAKYTHEASEKLYRQGKYAQAEALCKQAITDLEKTGGLKAWQLADPLNDLATVYMRQARFAEAKLVIERADTLLDKTKPEQALLAGRLGINKGWRLYTLGETDAATKVFEDALALVEQNSKEPGGGETIDRAELINNLGLMYEDQGEKDQDDALTAKARTCLIQGWEMRRNLTGDFSPETGESLNNLGMHLLFNGRDPSEEELALKLLRKSLEVAIKVYGESHPETAVSHATLGLALLMHDQADEAEKEVRIAIPMTQKFLGDKHPDLAYELVTLGHILQGQAHFDDAEKKFQEALAIDEEAYGKTHPNVVPVLQALKKLYDDKGDPAKAQEMESRIEKLSGKDI
jgi:tetratricopeptide (TPR) repeat protein